MNTRDRTLGTLFSQPLRYMLASLTLVVAAGFAHNASAQPVGPGPRGGMAGGMHEMGGSGGMLGGHHLTRMLDLVGATTDQRTQIKTITDAARADLKTIRTSGATLHQQMQAAFTAATVDARAVEALRVQILAQHDAASKRMTQAMLDVSRVLSADQRKTLADVMAKRQAMMKRHAAERATIDGSTK